MNLKMTQVLLPNEEAPEAETNNGRNEEEKEVVFNQEVDFKPIIELPLVDVKTLEEEETELIKLRARLYRYENDSGSSEWKERGTGNVKLLKHKTKPSVRLLMRRDHTFKLCANHYITSNMELKPHSNNEKAFIWSTLADFADEISSKELLCIRFGSVENANKFKQAFEQSKKIVSALKPTLDTEENDLASQLNQVSLNKTENKEAQNEFKQATESNDKDGQTPDKSEAKSQQPTEDIKHEQDDHYDDKEENKNQCQNDNKDDNSKEVRDDKSTSWTAL